MYGLTDLLVNQIIAAAQNHEVSKLVLFGSRARGDFRLNSDIDLAAYGLHPRNEMAFLSALDNLPTLLKFDMVAIRRETDSSLLNEIERDGVILMEQESREQLRFAQTLQRLQEGLKESKSNSSTVLRDGVIHRFEIAAELAWKACREKLLEEGYINIDSPKAVIRQAYAAGIVEYEEIWISLLEARNTGCHMYSDEQATQLLRQIERAYCPLLASLQEKLNTE